MIYIDFCDDKNEEEADEKPKIESERGMSPTMSLVIGIIIGSFTAMILIVIIVLKVRTGVDISEIKQVKCSFLQQIVRDHSSITISQSMGGGSGKI